MKIQIISERKVGGLKPIFTECGVRYVRSIYYAIKKVKIGRKIVPNVTFAEINTSSDIEPIYGTPRTHIEKSTTLTLETNGKSKTYEILKYKGTQEGDIRTINLEVKS